ncbi:mannose-1-phosphate guanylyltransferase [Candidatus Omnitrophota bacterium]
MIHAIILAGGWGRRLWPKSRRRMPKQIIRLGNRPSSLETLVKQLSKHIPKQRIWLVVNKNYAPSLRRHLPTINKKNFLVEPLARNTAAAIGWASLAIKRIDPQALTVVLPSDNILTKDKSFWRAVRAGSLKAEQGDALVTIGMKPHRPAPEFGHIKIAQSVKLKTKNCIVCKIEKFVEKPNLKKAQRFWKSGNYLWNSGMFIWRVNSFLQAAKWHHPGLYSGLQRIDALWGRPQYKNRLAREYKKFKDISVDYAVLEKAKNTYVVVSDFSWGDLGSWANLTPDLLACDNQGNLISGLCKNIDTHNSVIFSAEKHLIATLGVRDLIVVHTPVATLVCKKDRAQEVKGLTEVLEKDKHLKHFL